MVALLLTVGCASTPAPSRQIDDAALSASVRQALQRDPVLGGYDIIVDARRGAVTLIGTVASAADRERAARVAGTVDGVEHVENRLELR